MSQTASLLTHAKVIKMLTIESSIIEYIQHLRAAELEQSKLLHRILISGKVFGGFAESITPVLVIGSAMFWTASSDNIGPADVFTIVSIMWLMTIPLLKLLTVYSCFASVFNCIKRIQDFLLLKERQDQRIDWESMESQSERGTPALAARGDNDIVISCRSISIKAQSGSSIIHNASFTFQRSTVTVITGPASSGKTGLLRALLGEVSFTGDIVFHPLRSVIAYCDQVPWICNASIRHNIVRENKFDLAWYKIVLNVCLLSEDLMRISDSDEAIAGGDGIYEIDGVYLREEQKQRIALARAIYSRAPIMILDDVFRGLDSPTSGTISQRLLGNNGLLRDLGITVIIASQSILHATLADKVIFLDGAGNVETRPLLRGWNPTDPVTLAMQQYDRAAQSTPQFAVHLSAEEKAKKPAMMEAQEDRMLQRRSNQSLYYFYFQSTKKWVAILWLILLLISTTSEEMPSKFCSEISPAAQLILFNRYICSILA